MKSILRALGWIYRGETWDARLHQAIHAMLIGAVLMVLLTRSCVDGIVKQGEADDKMRSDRCAAYGENLPEELEPYCKGQ